MGEQWPADRNGSEPPPDDPLDAGLAAAFGPDPDPPLAAEVSVLERLRSSLAAVPHVQLREPEEEVPAPLVLPGSPAMPPRSDTADRAGRYQLLGEITRGGMGAILKGRDVDLGRDIAVKVLLETHVGRAELAQRFVEEAQITGQLQHPGIVPVYELGLLADRRPFFTMKLVKGQTLAALLNARQDLAAERPRILGIFDQVCQTLAYAHARGVIHRDLKPSNVMVGSFGEVQVMDWGLAKVLKGGGVADEIKARQQHRRLEEGSGLREQETASGSQDASFVLHPSSIPATLAGSVLGTPAFMAPEQARGAVELVDERTDVFGLGAILCEILTGQPPFTGQRADVQRKARLGQLDEAYQRLDGCGAGPELIALAKHCLAADPGDRPRHAGKVAEAMTEYQRSLAQRLRQAELDRVAAEARATAERKRRVATVALVAAVFALLLGTGAALTWWWYERTALVRDVEAALSEAVQHENADRWPEARAALARASGRLGDAGPAALRERLRQAQADAHMVAQLDEVRMHLSEGYRTLDENRVTADHWYAQAFINYGIPVMQLAPEVAAERVRRSAIRETLQASLHDWLYWAPPSDRDRVRAVVERADDSPWRRAFRESLANKGGGPLHTLARQPEAQAQPPVIVSCLADALSRVARPEEGATLLRKARQRHPQDFWINHLLGLFLYQARPQEALGYSRVAVALRPSSGEAHTVLGECLLASGDLDGAVEAFQTAQQLDPNRDLGLGVVYDLESKGRLKEAQGIWQRLLESDPPDFGAWFGYAELCLYLGQEPAYHLVCRELLDRFGQTRDPLVAERVSRACLLLPAADDELLRAAALINRAALAHPEYLRPYIQFAQGLAEYRQNRPEQAVPLLLAAASRIPYPSARLVLAMAQYRCRAEQAARVSLETAVRSFNWKEPQPARVDWWVCHILRHEAEATIHPRGAASR